MTHNVTITETKTWESRVVPKKGYDYGVRKDYFIPTFGYKCGCGLKYDAYDGTSTKTNAKLIAREEHAKTDVIEWVQP